MRHDIIRRAGRLGAGEDRSLLRVSFCDTQHVKKMKFKEIIKGGKLFYSIADAARLLGTTKADVQALMGADLLEWDQTRLNGRLIVNAKSIERYKLCAGDRKLEDLIKKKTT
jgi:hypothetical protein